ncbi:hypothetical protein D3C87_1565780 [compost metagenome]
MRPEAETEGGFGLAINVEYIGVFKGVFVAVGGHHHALDERTLGDFHAVKFHFPGGFAHLESGHGFKARGFVHQLADQ